MTTTENQSETPITTLSASDRLALVLALLPTLDRDPESVRYCSQKKYNDMFQGLLTDMYGWEWHQEPQDGDWEKAVALANEKPLDKLIHALSGRIAGKHHSPKRPKK